VDPVAMTEPNGDSREYGLYLAMAQCGIEMVVPLALGAWLDYVMGWTPWAAVAGAVLGFVGGMIHLISMSNKIGQSQSKKKKNGS
jgi:F0F1-type ATP synthase assembly protein I